LPHIRPLKDADNCDIWELIEMYNAMVRLFFKEDPDKLSDDEFARRIEELRWLSEEGFLRGT